MKHTVRSGTRLRLLTLLLIAAAGLSLLLGAVPLSMAEVLHAALHRDWTQTSVRIFLYVRLPRTLGGIFCGSGMAVAGAILQTVLNNSMAGPNIIGVNAGAGFAALLVMAVFPAAATLLPVAAFFGALACTLLIYFTAGCTGVSRTTIVLSGLAVSGILNAASSCIKTFCPDVLADYNRFSVGTLNGVTLRELSIAWPYLLIGLVLAVLLSGDMNVLALGEETAQALGLHVERCRMLLLMTASVLAGVSVSFAGLIGFVGLLVPHAVRALLGTTDARWVIPGAALLGATSVLVCDLLGRILFAPFELPVGIVLSIVGGIGFIILLLRTKGGRLHA